MASALSAEEVQKQKEESILCVKKEPDEKEDAQKQFADTSACTRAQAFVFKGMLPTLGPELNEEWQNILARQGERGIEGLKNAFRNRIVKKYATSSLSGTNLKDFNVSKISSKISSNVDKI